MNRRALGVSILTFLAMVLVTASASARMRMTRPINVQMELYVGAAPADAKPQFQWLVADRDGEYQLQIMKLSVIGGVSALDLDAALKPYRIHFRIAGDPASVKRLTGAKPAQLLDVHGIARFQGGARYLMLDRVEPMPTVDSPGR